MKIGIDIDDTIAKTSEETDFWAEEYTEKILKRKFILKKGIILNPMWARELYGWNQEENDQFWDLYYEKIMSNVKPKEDAVESIYKLAKNNEIIVITARWDRESGVIEKITQQWLQKYKIAYNQLFLGQLDKREVVRKNNIELFIDDSFKTCQQISEMNIKTMIMNSRINQNLQDDRLERVFDWKDILKKLEN